jgi:mannose-6-phosphate isomerase-like protein (cupin superfamily)
VQHSADVPFNFLRIDVDGRHATRKVLAGIRNYYVVSGSGCFTVETEACEVIAGDLITIQPGEVYSYQGKMELVEFNVDTGYGIAHEDLE